jgi:2-dehydro-3-deoxyglucarate aldolase
MKLSWQQIPNSIITEILCQTKLDGVVLDTEHSAFNPETLYNCIQVCTLNKKKCFVRLISPIKKDIRMCLDAGCDGLIFSMMENSNQAKRVKKQSIYPKYGGGRGLGLVRENLWGLEKNLVKKPPVLIAQIETLEGVENLKEILDKNVFDFFMIGPYDLSASVGHPGDFENSDFLNAVKSINDLIEVEKMAVHIPNNVKKELKKYNNYGIIALGMDTTFLIEKYKEMEKYA